jgi:cytochrome oxidase Cu insertion factor (SCO1/SenC/PrrC family)
VQHLVNWAGSIWSYHPVQASASAVWIQVGIGIWMVAAKRGPWSRLAGLVSAGWGLIVWMFGEAFGGVFAPGLTALFGAPGAVLFYCAAGVLVALPERSWQSAALGRRLISGLGLLFVGMAVLQAWPGRGFWQGTDHGRPGSLTAMITAMSGTPQPAMFAHLVSGFAAFDSRHGFGVNLFAVAALGLIGAGLLSAGLLSGGLFRAALPRAGLLGVGLLRRRPRLLLATVIAATVLCLADWVLIEDLGFLGGLGTDPNSMIPILLLVLSCYLATTRAVGSASALATSRPTAPQPAPEAAPQPAPEAAPQPAPEAALQPAPEAAPQPAPPQPGWRERIRPARLAGAFAATSAQGIVACWAAAVVVLGAAPMALAQANPNADPIIAQAIDGSSAPINFTAPGFLLTDQHGRQISLAGLRGKVVLMTFLDPVCTTDCPLIAQEFRAADQMLGARASAVTLVAVVVNPLYYTAPYVQAFDRQERLTGLRNWLFLTGTPAQLRRVWHDYGITAAVAPGGQMIAHNDLAFVIDPRGQIRTELNMDPGPGTASSRSSFAVELSQAALRVMSPSRALS